MFKSQMPKAVKGSEQPVLTLNKMQPDQDRHCLSRIMRKPDFCICKNKVTVKTVTAQLISTFVFATQIVQILYFLNPKFQSVVAQELEIMSTTLNLT